MDLYLPADFYRLRDDLNDWRDVCSAVESRPSPDHPAIAHRDDSADPNWRTL